MDVYSQFDKVSRFKDAHTFLVSTSHIRSKAGIGSNEEGSIIVAVCGEINNYKQLYKKLRTKHDFKSINYPEVVAHLYESSGLNALKKLRGSFSLAIWDSERKRLILAKDIMSGKSLFYTIKDGCVIFSTKLINVIKYADVKFKIDETALNLYFSLSFIPPPKTIIRKIRKIPCATALIFQNGKTFKYRYWRPIYNFEYNSENNFLINLIYETLRESIKIRMVNDDKTLATSLSGGLDSSLITAILRRLSPSDEIRAFTVGFEYKEYDELDAAISVAEHLGLKHYYSVLTGDQVLRFLPNLYEAYDEPMFDDSAIATYHVCELAKKYETSIYSGEGSDTIFYGLVSIEKIVNSYKRIPKFLRTKLIEPLFPTLIAPFSKELERKTRKLIALSKNDFLIITLSLAMSEEELSKFYNTKERPGKNAGLKYLMKFYKKVGKYSTDYSDIRHYIVFASGNLEDAIKKVEQVCDFMNMSLKLPYTDSNVVKLSFKISSKLKLKNNIAKYLFKKVALKYNLLPRKIVYRKKHGFGTPIEHWFLKELKNEVYNGLMENPYAKNLFNMDTLKKLFREIKTITKERRHSRARILWGTYMFVKWYEYYSNI